MAKTADRIARLRSLLLTRPAKIIGLLLVVYAICGFVLAPWLVQRQLPVLVAEHLNGARGSVGAVRINPFLMTFDATDLAISENNGTPVFNSGRLFVDFELSSLFRWAWTFREIRIERPLLNADLDAQENLNLLRLLPPDRKTPDAAAPRTEKTPLPRLLLQQLAITDGAFHFTDHTLKPAVQAKVSPFSFEMHDISTLPDRSGDHVLAAKLPDGGDLQWSGKLGLSPLDSSGSITLKDARLSTLWKFVQDELVIAEPKGRYSAGLRYRITYSAGKLNVHTDDLNFVLKDLAVARQNDGATLARLGTVAFEGGSFDLAQRSLDFKNIRVADGELNVVLDEDSVPDWAKLVRSNAAEPAAQDKKAVAKKEKKIAMETADKKNAAGRTGKDQAAVEPRAATGKPWRIALPRVSVGQLAFTVVDQSRTKPVRISAGSVQVDLGATAEVGQTQVSVSDGKIAINDIQVMAVDDKEPHVTLASAEVNGAAFDLQKKTIHAGLVRLSGGRTWAMRDADGRLHLVSLFAPRKQKPLQEAGFVATIDRAEIAGYTVALTDKSFTPTISYDLEQVNATASQITIPPTKTASPVELALKVKQGGSLRGKGTINLLQQSADVRIEATDIALMPLDTILKRETTLTLHSGKASSSGRAVASSKDDSILVQYKGNATVTDLDLKLENSAERLVNWQRLQVDGIDLDTGKNQLTVGQVSLARPYSRLIINKDRSTNLGSVMRPRPAGSAPAPAAAEPAAPMAVVVERVSVERGEVDFTDLSLVLPFATNVKSLSGSINGLSSAQESRASLKFEGRIEDYGLARAEGTVQAFAPKKFTDIAVIFRNVELQPLSPYSATFAGRKIASGRVSLDLQYKLNNSQLSGDNKILLEKFTLGERVESPDAVNLPLDLAIALLTDSNGVIDLAVPVSGNVDSPEFSYGHVVWQAIRTVITRIVSAPFRALGSLFGADAETLGDIVFDPGSARILPTEYDKVRRVAEGLQKRAQLRLVVQGSYHTQADSRGLRTIAVRAELANREGIKLAPGEDPGPIGFDSPKVQRALENMLDERAGANAAAQFATGFQKSAGRETARVNAALALMGRGAGDRELYVAMHQKLIELQPLPPAALEDLAKARAAAISNAFINRFKFDPVRVTGKPPAATEETVKNGVPLKLSFEPMPK